MISKKMVIKWQYSCVTSLPHCGLVQTCRRESTPKILSSNDPVLHNRVFGVLALFEFQLKKRHIMHIQSQTQLQNTNYKDHFNPSKQRQGYATCHLFGQMTIPALWHAEEFTNKKVYITHRQGNNIEQQHTSPRVFDLVNKPKQRLYVEWTTVRSLQNR